MKDQLEFGSVGLAATDMQSAIDELKGLIDTIQNA